MKRLPRMVHRLKESALLLAFLLFTFTANALAADEQADRRMLLGLKLFPAVVSADQDLASKLSREGHVRLVLLYRENADSAADAAKRLRAASHLKEFDMQVEVLPYGQLAALEANPPTAIFLAEWVPDELPQVIRFGATHHRLIFSPFKGDVAAGVQTGIFITDHILPLVNLTALESAGIHLKPFLLEVAKTHE